MRRGGLALAASAALVAAGVAYLAASRGGGARADQTVTPADASPALDKTLWNLVEYARPGSSPAPVPDGLESPSTFHIDVTGRLAAYACNALGGDVAVAGNTFTVGTMEATSKGCAGAERDLEVVVQAVLGAPVTWRVDGERLTLTSAGGELRYVADEEGLPGVTSIAAGVIDGWEYHLRATGSAEEQTVFLHSRVTGGEWAHKVLVTPEPDDAPLTMTLVQPAPAGFFVAGFAPDATARVTYSLRGRTSELAVHEMRGTRWKIYGGMVPEADRVAEFRAYDSDGREIARRP